MSHTEHGQTVCALTIIAPCNVYVTCESLAYMASTGSCHLYPLVQKNSGTLTYETLEAKFMTRTDKWAQSTFV